MEQIFGHSKGYGPKEEKVLNSWVGGGLREIRPGVFVYSGPEYYSRALAAREAVTYLQDSLSRLEQHPFNEAEIQESRRRTEMEISELYDTVLVERKEAKFRAMKEVFNDEKILETVTGPPYEKSKNREIALETLRERFAKFFAEYPEALLHHLFRSDLERIVKELEPGESEAQVFAEAKKNWATALESTRKLLREAIGLMNSGG